MHLRRACGLVLHDTYAASVLNQIGADVFILYIGFDAVPQGALQWQKPRCSLTESTSLWYPEHLLLHQTRWHLLFKDVQRLPSQLLVRFVISWVLIPSTSFRICLLKGSPCYHKFRKRDLGTATLLCPTVAYDFGAICCGNSKHSTMSFSRKSFREAVSMAPQQRVLLQVACEILESSGYFAKSSRPENIGCYNSILELVQQITTST